MSCQCGRNPLQYVYATTDPRRNRRSKEAEYPDRPLGSDCCGERYRDEETPLKTLQFDAHGDY